MCNVSFKVFLLVYRAEQKQDGPNYNLSGKLTEYTNTYKVNFLNDCNK